MGPPQHHAGARSGHHSHEAFLREIPGFSIELAESIERCDTEFARLGEGWQDDRYQQFSEEWSEAAQPMSRYLERSADGISFLQDKVAALRAYLGVA